ncbi:MAG: hypothetical protein EZS28_020605 [Streblomastix strix]|uniref:Uncharacterized protein n=1 Tax=Streblomastix strix TaxID=222440 RepID=A0A5J4VMJ9_9EUKA|nr:MAG: hypothetical protein EZS28_020605 [Streblomastix strix]
MLSTDELQNRYAPQYLIFKRSKEQKVWILLNRHYQSKVSNYEQLESEDKEKIEINMTICKYENPEQFPYLQRVIHRHANSTSSLPYVGSHFQLFQIGLYDEDIHQIKLNEPGLLDELKPIAKVQEFVKDYVGWFSIRLGIYQVPKHGQGELRFSMYVFSDQELIQPVRIKIHHECEVDVDAHWSEVPMLEFNNGFINRKISPNVKGKISPNVKGKIQHNDLSIRNSVGITAEKRSWEDKTGNKLMQVLSKAFDSESIGDAFYRVARYLLGTQVDLILTPNPEADKYGEKMEIWSEWSNGVEGGIFFDEVENAQDAKANVGVGGYCPITLYDDQWIEKGIAYRTKNLKKEKVGQTEQVVVKKRTVRVIPFTYLKNWNCRSSFTLQSIGPEGYDVQFEQRRGPWQIMTNELAWTDTIKAEQGARLNNGPRSNLFYILKTSAATNLHIHIIALQRTSNQFSPQLQFSVVKLSGPQLVNEDAIALRLIGASEKIGWGKKV